MKEDEVQKSKLEKTKSNENWLHSIDGFVETTVKQAKLPFKPKQETVSNEKNTTNSNPVEPADSKKENLPPNSSETPQKVEDETQSKPPLKEITSLSENKWEIRLFS